MLVIKNRVVVLVASKLHSCDIDATNFITAFFSIKEAFLQMLKHCSKRYKQQTTDVSHMFHTETSLAYLVLLKKRFKMTAF